MSKGRKVEKSGYAEVLGGVMVVVLQNFDYVRVKTK